MSPSYHGSSGGWDSGSPSSHGMLSGATGPSKDIHEDQLTKLADDIPNSKVDDVGRYCGFKTAQIQRFQMTNTKGDCVTCHGTVEMLQTWYQKTSKKVVYADLREVLIKAGLTRVADDHLPE